MIHSLFVICSSGEVLIERHWAGVTSRAVCDFFWECVNQYSSREEVPPIITTAKYYLISVLRDDIFFLVTTTGEVPPLLAIEFLHRVFDIFQEYFGTVEETTLRENFSTVYQLLEEMMDNGYPLTTEPNVLKAMIRPPTLMGKFASMTTGRSNISDVLPDGTISSMPWRKVDVKYAQNEIYLDIVEEVDCIVDRNGQVVSCEVSGTIQANSRLSGVPDLTLTFVDPEVIDDCSFHPCVRYNRYERERVVSFVPPDGVFELMRYRVNPRQPVSAPIFCSPQLSFDHVHSQGSIALTVGQRPSSLIFPSRRGTLVVEDVEVTVPFSRAVRTANLTVGGGGGTCLYDEAAKVARWTVGKLGRDKTATLNGTIILQAGANQEESPPIQLDWRVPMASVSGLAVAGLQL
eukprot:CAMPEP_0198436644 /NCGR_PEP_ID=MMETSP1452-20131203/43458_1 /TAXON_ID=1181717 /ORGANISM="Synchroma pusillum, Strain CCMP3072" /LENGTH=403 /DNA_ID=CAMNT_0044157207 /DNA_START=24 /DNA_END=1231 /DNA_ORIENTATION=-